MDPEGRPVERPACQDATLRPRVAYLAASLLTVRPARPVNLSVPCEVASLKNCHSALNCFEQLPFRQFCFREGKTSTLTLGLPDLGFLLET